MTDILRAMSSTEQVIKFNYLITSYYFSVYSRMRILRQFQEKLIVVGLLFTQNQISSNKGYAINSKLSIQRNYIDIR